MSKASIMTSVHSSSHLGLLNLTQPSHDIKDSPTREPCCLNESGAYSCSFRPQNHLTTLHTVEQTPNIITTAKSATEAPSIINCRIWFIKDYASASFSQNPRQSLYNALLWRTSMFTSHTAL